MSFRNLRCLPTVILFLLPATLGACAGDDPGYEDEPAASQSAALASFDELQFVRRAHATYIAGATDARFQALKDVGTGGDSSTQKSSYYRTTCSLALAGALVARKDNATPSPMVTAWIREAIAEYPNFSLDAWGHHVKLAPAVDCLLAAAVARPFLTTTERDRLRAAVSSVATDVYAKDIYGPDGRKLKSRVSPADYRVVGKKYPGNTQAEEAAVGADFFYLASQLAVDAGDQRNAWRARADALFRYAGMRPNAGDLYEGEPFRRTAEDGRALGADETVVTNHGLEVSPYYSLGALLSYADATVVARATEPAPRPELAPGLTKDRRATTDGVRAGEQLGIRDVVGGGLRHVDRTTFGFSGAYRFVGDDGKSNLALDYGAQTQTIPKFPPGWELLIPTTGVGRGAPAGAGTVSQFFDPLTKSVLGYQINGSEVRAFACSDEPARGWMCRARYRSTLDGLFSPANIREQSRFGGRALPSSGVQAMPQWFDPEGRLHTEVIAGSRVWHYQCAGATATTRVCTAIDSVDLATHYGRLGFTAATMPPTSDLDSASTTIHIDGTGRRYWTKGNRIWRARCDSRFTACAVSSDTLQNQFGSLAFDPALPIDRVEAMTQFVRNGVLSTYVFKGDRIWKYDCGAAGCTPAFTRPMLAQWQGITNQERWAYGVTTTLKGVTDWGVQATMMNSAFALASVLGVDGGAYGQLLARQRGDELKLGTQTLFPSTFDTASGVFGYGVFQGASSVRVHGPIHALQDGWTGGYFTPAQRLNTFTWMNAFAARNHAVAYMLVSGETYVRPLFGRD